MAPGLPRAGRLWSIILAGGEGIRLRPLVQRIHPDGRPKQFAVLVGTRSLLRQTLDRVALATPRERTVVVTTRPHAPFFSTEFSQSDAPKVLIQPSDRGTAAGVLLPVHWIARQDPRATVAVFPSDHFVADDAAFMHHVAELAGTAERHPTRICLVGVEPDSADPGYGWIDPGPRLANGSGNDIRLVDGFWEKPSPETARASMDRGGLWNSFVMVGKVSALAAAGRSCLPSLHERLVRIRPFLGGESERESRALDSAYALAPHADFSQSVLAASVRRLAVSRLSGLLWSDWGTPDRVIQTLRRQGIVPDWLQELATSA